MNAMLKRRMWKAFCYHYGLTVCVVLIVLLLPQHRTINPSDPSDWIGQLGIQFLYFLQPISCLIVNHDRLAFIVMPIWSVCFGWIFVKFLNWLNHFPVLGKKVF